MKDKTISERVLALIIRIYERVLNEKMNTEGETFFKNITYIFFGTGLGTLLSLIFNIYAGRVLDPVGYGEFTLVNSIAMFIYIPMNLGVGTAMVKYNAAKESLEENSVIISTTFQLISLFTIVTCLAYALLSSQLSSLLSIDRDIFFLALFYAILFVIYTLMINTLRSLHWMKKIAYLTVGYNAIMLTTFFLFTQMMEATPFYAVFSVYIGYILIVLASLVLIRKFMTGGFSKEWAMKLIKYGLFTTISGFSYIIYTNVDKLILYAILGFGQVGIYKAYTFASINIIGIISGIFITVYFPTASKQKDKGMLFSKIRKLTPLLFIFGIPLSIMSQFVILKFYGDEYPIILTPVLLFSLAAVLLSLNSIYAWTLNSIGISGLKITCIGTATLAVVNVCLNLLLIPVIGITGAVFSTVIASVLSIILLYFLGTSLVKGGRDKIVNGE